MRTFIDDNRIYGSTFLLYGNINDDFYCPDATMQKMDQYLVTLLKKRGYDHIIFFGSGGTRGAYCLDAQSARFFFNANQGAPQVGDLRTCSQDGANPDGMGTATVSAGTSGRTSVGSRVRSGKKKRRGGYNPGDLSESAPQDASAQPQEAVQAEAPARVQYALRKITVSSFYTQFREKMMDSNSRMAIVFYNVLTDNGGQNSIFLPSLKDDILTNFAQVGDHNLCLIVAPDTMDNTCDLQNLLRGNGLGSKFLKPVSDTGTAYTFNTECCFQLGYPGADEIKNMLYRFAVVGTSRHKRISFDYGKIDELAEKILINASLASQRKNNAKFRKMRVIAYTLEEYIHSKGRGKRRVEITEDVIDDIWDIHVDPQEAMKKLGRKGWEEAYEKVRRAVRSSQNAVRNIEAEESTREHIPDMGLERYAQEIAKEEGPRPPVPNFILLGHPGTGKTEIARLIGQILHAEGILKIGHTREVKQQDLTNSYVAGIPRETMARVDEAEEGVLFIDEAHSLGRQDGSMNNEGSGKQVVSTLVGAMTDRNRHFCTILAGYPEEMDAVLNLDPGFTRRFTTTIRLDDYEPDLLYDILLGMIRDRNYELAPELTEEQTAEDGKKYIPLQAMVERIYAERDREKFGNAGDMKVLADYATGMNEGDDRTLRQESFYGGLGKVTAEFFKPMNIGMTKEKIFEIMDREYVGMENVKKMLRRKANAIERVLADGGKPGDIPVEPIILVGNPGAGKTVVAKTLAQLYFYYGMLGTPECMEHNANNLVSPYRDDTTRVAEVIKLAQDKKGFLFVDEAHNLNAQTLKAFMAPLTDKKHPFVACFAVYCDELEKFLALDPGSRSRFEKNLIRLEDYTPEEMFEIFDRAMRKKGYSADERTMAMVKQLMKREYETRTTQTGNARHVLNILDEMLGELDERCVRDDIPFGTPESRSFVETDIPDRYRKGLSAGDNASRLDELKAMEDEILNHRVGNAELKTVITGLLKKYRFQLRFPDKSTGIIEPGHYFFKGNAGTGKTTSLNYLGSFLFRMGIVKDPAPVLLSASRLVGQYLGETAVQTRTLLEQNIGRLIMIDEAYALSDPNDRANSYKRDAINEIVAKLDDPVFRKTTCVVFAGYEGDMDGLYRENQGLRSRVKEIAFPDFTFEECMKILSSMLEDQHAPANEDVLERCGEQVAFMQRCRGFSNGRTLRNYAAILVSNRENRMLDASDEEAEAPDFSNIQMCDLPPQADLSKKLNL